MKIYYEIMQKEKNTTTNNHVQVSIINSYKYKCKYKKLYGNKYLDKEICNKSFNTHSEFCQPLSLIDLSFVIFKFSVFLFICISFALNSSSLCGNLLPCFSLPYSLVHSIPAALSSIIMNN